MIDKYRDLLRLATIIHQTKDAFNELKRELKLSGISHHDLVTVYKVKKSKVKAHTRKGFLAVRVNVNAAKRKAAK